MQKPALIFEHSPWFLLLCLLAGAAYALLLYTKSGPWSTSLNKLLFVCRMLTVTIIAALLISPVLKQIKNIIEQPAMIFAIDNSRSLGEVMDSVQLRKFNDKIKQVASGIEDQYRIEFRNLSGVQSDEFPEFINYNKQSTDLSSLLNDIKQDYEGRNLGGVVLVSDGIYNQGISPTFADYNFDVFTLGVGDTIPKSDLSIISLLYNKISYQGNKFPLIAQVTHRGYTGEQVTVSVIKNGNVIADQQVKLGADNQLVDVKFLIDAEENGYQRYQVSVQRKDGEFTYTNNLQQAYIEVIEGKEQIALLAPAPHPDIKAIKSAVESNANYTIDQYILSLNEDVQKLSSSKKKYDLVIYHQIPDQSGLYSRFADKFEKEKTSALIIYGSQTNVREFNTFNKVLSLDAIPGEYDHVTAVFNQGFNSFKLSDELQQSMDEFPPVVVPFGRISMSSDADILLYQQVGSIATNKPLIAVMHRDGNKRGVVLGSGLWLWKLTNYAKNGNDQAFNELMTKLVQYLSSKEDKRKFKTYPVKNEFLTNEKVVFDTEVYNDLYERVYGNKIDLSLTDAEGNKYNYSYITNENNTRYEVSGLPEGVYGYMAATQLGDKREVVNGEFLIKELQIENINLTADFNLLRKLSDKTGGKFYRVDEIDRFKDELATFKAQGTIHTSEKYLPFIHLKWLFFLLMFLLTSEWLIRKYSGGY
ncbi:hypothetical protein JMN32_11735 [Fulvivirga sp. 29W222]|uniref:VWA domain-containing protein n=1 Tax=Fulvivirga marina TaxID=2494733 RepID=A0A937FZ13_9BACT|nr:hypothetical protein [Fulvivirga marina]MBL6446985.1 hypothetical protein [Fulvivirga marina]